MQTRRQWDSKTKAKIVMEGLQGRSVVDICIKTLQLEHFAIEMLYEVERSETEATTPEQSQFTYGCSGGGVKPASQNTGPGWQIFSRAKRSKL